MDKISDSIWTANPFPPLTGNAEKISLTGNAEKILLTGNAEKISLTGANETLCAMIHRRLCDFSPVNDLAAHNATLSQLSPDDVVAISVSITHPAVQSGDVRGIMAMRAPLSAPETAIPEVKASPAGLGTIGVMDHRLGAWK